MKLHNKIENSFDEKLVFAKKKDSLLKQLFKSSGTPLLPSFFIVGAQKAGTSSLAFDLSKHPKILAPKQKEIYFFNNNHFNKKGMEWYSTHFSQKKEPAEITFDATANYLESDVAPERIKETFPNAKIVILLRNPIDRAYSHYKMAVKLGFEKLSFEDALDIEDDRLAYATEHYVPEHKHDYVFQRLAYRTKGIYVNFLKNWMRVFSPEELLVIQSEVYFKNPAPVYNLILEKLGVNPFNLESFNLLNKGIDKQLSFDTRKKLMQFYEPHNEELYKLLGKKYNWK
jgi:hypothetical protein